MERGEVAEDYLGNVQFMVGSAASKPCILPPPVATQRDFYVRSHIRIVPCNHLVEHSTSLA